MLYNYKYIKCLKLKLRTQKILKYLKTKNYNS